MSNSSEGPLSNHPNAHHITPLLYTTEKEFLSGVLLGAISYGVVVALFFQCISVLLSPVNSLKKGIKWALVAHTVLMFSFFTIPLGIILNMTSLSYVSNREFTGGAGLFPGPFGYSGSVYNWVTILFDSMFPLNQWLADGLLLHRCYVIYSMNHWVMAFPYLMYIGSIAMGMGHIYQVPDYVSLGTSYLSICLSLSVLLTLMIITRLVLHIKNIRGATRAPDGSSSLHTAAATVVTMLIESYALYTIALLVYVVPWAYQNWAMAIFSGISGAGQVIAPYLIILRVADRRAVTNESISGTSESIHFRSQGSTDSDGSVVDRDLTNSVGINDEASGELVARDDNVIEEVPL